MNKWIPLICTSCLMAPGSFAQTNPFSDSGIFLLHKFAQHIGQEKYTSVRSSGLLTYSIDFKFVDRGAPVPMQAVLQLQSNLDPVSLKTHGQSSRFSVCNDTVIILNQIAHIREGDSSYKKKISSPTFTVAGYSPGTVQMLMIQYWKKNNRPGTISLLPSGEVRVMLDGLDTFSLNGKELVLERYIVNGLIWGNELLWTDQAGQLYCLITNDAEGDKLEMMLEPYEDLLPEFISRAATSSMRLFKSLSAKIAIRPAITAITGGTVIDVINNKKIPDALVILENGIIKSVGPYSKAAIPSQAHILDARGKFILPGLWDMHAHFEQAEWGPAYLAAGVTTVRDCGNEFEYINAVKKAIDEGSGIGPHIIKAGIIDGIGPYSLGVIKAETAEAAVKAVRRYRDNGFEQIKIYSSVKPAIVKAICDEAHRLGLTVTGHIPIGMTIFAGVDSGMDMVNHIDYVYREMKTNKKDQTIDFTDSSNQRVINFLKNKHTVIDPTLSVFEMIFRSLKDSITIIEPAFSTLPLPLQAMLGTTGMAPERAKTMEPVFAMVKKTVKALHDNGIPLVAGTDMGMPGFSVYRELELYVQAGLTPTEALQTATIIPARVMKKDQDYGSVEAGKKADLILVDGDPIMDIRQIRHVSTIIKDGNIYQPGPLHRMVGFSK